MIFKLKVFVRSVIAHLTGELRKLSQFHPLLPLLELPARTLTIAPVTTGSSKGQEDDKTTDGIIVGLVRQVKATI